MQFLSLLQRFCRCWGLRSSVFAVDAKSRLRVYRDFFQMPVRASRGQAFFVIMEFFYKGSKIGDRVDIVKN